MWSRRQLLPAADVCERARLLFTCQTVGFCFIFFSPPTSSLVFVHPSVVLAPPRPPASSAPSKYHLQLEPRTLPLQPEPQALLLQGKVKKCIL